MHLNLLPLRLFIEWAQLIKELLYQLFHEDSRLIHYRLHHEEPKELLLAVLIFNLYVKDVEEVARLQTIFFGIILFRTLATFG